jgi:hypothetical protein
MDTSNEQDNQEEGVGKLFVQHLPDRKKTALLYQVDSKHARVLAYFVSDKAVEIWEDLQNRS